MGTHRHSTIRRAGLLLICVSALVLVPWWVYVCIWLVFMVYVPHPFEIILAGFLFDVVHLYPAGIYFFPGLLISIALISVYTYIKPRVAWFND